MPKLARPGRPSKAGKRATGKRYPLNMRTTAAIRERLVEAAAQSGRSLAQEVEARLERSFRDQRLLDQVLELAYGRQLAGVIIALGGAMAEAARRAVFAKTYTTAGFADWLSDPQVCEHVAIAGQDLLALRVKPPGEVEPITDPHGSAELNEENRTIGPDVAREFFDAMREPLSMPHLGTRQIAAQAERLMASPTEDK